MDIANKAWYGELSSPTRNGTASLAKWATSALLASALLNRLPLQGVMAPITWGAAQLAREEYSVKRSSFESPLRGVQVGAIAAMAGHLSALLATGHRSWLQTLAIPSLSLMIPVALIYSTQDLTRLLKNSELGHYRQLVGGETSKPKAAQLFHYALGASLMASTLYAFWRSSSFPLFATCWALAPLCLTTRRPNQSFNTQGWREGFTAAAIVGFAATCTSLNQLFSAERYLRLVALSSFLPVPLGLAAFACVDRQIDAWRNKN